MKVIIIHKKRIAENIPILSLKNLKMRLSELRYSSLNPLRNFKRRIKGSAL